MPKTATVDIEKVEELLEDMLGTAQSVEPAIGGMVRNWADRLAASHGLVVHGGVILETA